MASDKKVLVTGAAGFIGFHLSRRLLAEGYAVTGLDNLNDYYDVTLKQARLELLLKEPNFSFVKANLADKPAIDTVFNGGFRYVVHLAAQAGVRYSLQHPYAYLESNLQPSWFFKYSGRMPAPPPRPPYFCFNQFGVRGQYQAALFGT